MKGRKNKVKDRLEVVELCGGAGRQQEGKVGAGGAE